MSINKINDLLIRYSNALNRKKNHIIIDNNQLNINICQRLKDEGILFGYQIDYLKKKMQVLIKNNSTRKIKSLSRPSHVIFLNVNDLLHIKRSKRKIIISSDKGLFNIDQALQRNIGGVALFEII